MKTVKRISPAPKLINGKHPLVVIRDSMPLNDLFAALGHANHTSVSAYAQRARKDKKLAIPAEWCLTLSRLSGIPLSELRPDVYLPEHKVKAEKSAKVAKPKAKAVKARKPKAEQVDAFPANPESGAGVDSTIG